MSKLITYAYMRKETDISQNVEDSVLDNRIKRAHDQLKFYIGRAFYDELISQVITTPTSLTSDNTAFYDPYVKQFIAWQAYQYYITRANASETRTGIRVYKEANSDPASDKTMGERVAEAKNSAIFYRDQMLNFLREQQRADSTKYPLYIDDCGVGRTAGFGITGVGKIDTTDAVIDQTLLDNGAN